MEQKTLLERLLRFDFLALDELKEATKQKNDLSEIAWRFLIQAGEDGRHVVSGFCEVAGEHLLAIKGQREFEQQILSHWSTWTTQSRQNVSYDLLASPNVITANTAQELFWMSASSLDDKYSILWNLFEKRQQRWIAKEDLLKMTSAMRPFARDPVRILVEEIEQELR